MTNFESYTDLELVSLINKEELPAFNEVYRRHWQILFQSAFNILGDQEAVMDILQDVFVWMWEHRGNLVITSLKGYLHAAVKYKAANYIRREKIKDSVFDDIRLAKLSHSKGESADENLEVKELKAIIGQFSAELPEKSRKIFTLSRMAYLSNKEIAIKLGISEKTVENQMTIALRKLRLSLGKMYFCMLFFI